MTIWHGDLFKLESTGESIPNGYKIYAELLPQVDERKLEDYTSQGESVARVILIVLIAGLVLTLLCRGSLIPVFGLFETIQLISHLPLVYTNLPSRLLTFLKPINDMVRFNFIFSGQIGLKLIDFFDINEDEKAFNERFSAYGYENALFVQNTISVIVALACVLIVMILALCVDFVLERLQKQSERIKGSLIPQLVNACVRFSILLFFELLLCSWLHFVSLKDNDFEGQATTSTWFALGALIICTILYIVMAVQVFPKRITSKIAKTLSTGLNV